jgi:probable HAF family extracellular repeat protein
MASVVVGNASGNTIEYTVTDLGTLPGAAGGSSAYGINENGQVVGFSGGEFPDLDAFVYSNGSMKELGNFGTYARAYGINDSGQVVINAGIQAFLYSNAQMTNLGGLPGATGAQGSAINSSGQVVGYCVVSGNARAFSYTNGTMTDLGTVAGNQSDATAINDRGQIVGGSGNQGQQHLFLYQNGSMTDLGVMPGSLESWGEGINNSGQIAGVAVEGGGGSYINQGFLYTKGTWTSVGFWNSSALGINDSGQVVGESFTGSANHAFLYSNGTTTDLNALINPASGWTLQSATAINDNSWIVGYGLNPSGQQDAFLLTPTPEPSSFLLLGVAAIGLLGWAWRRRQVS